MNDPERLLDKSGGLAAALLRAGAEERPSSTSLRRALAMIGASATVASIAAEAAGGGAGVLVSGAAGSTVTAVGAGSVSLALAAKWVAIGSFGGLLTVGAASRFTQDTPRPLAPPPVATIQQSAPLPPPPPTRHSIALAPIPPPAPAIALPAPSTTEVTGRPLAPPPRPDRAAIEPGRMKDETPLHAPQSYNRVPNVVPPTNAHAPPNVAESSLQLAKEVGLVDGAWAAMKRQEYARALTELAAYESAFPGLGLHPEVLFLRMEAEDRLGHGASARAHALRIVSIYPKSAQANRARALLGRP